jgi:hypothetical protein
MTNQAIEGRAVMRAAPSLYVRWGLICGMILLMWGFILSQRPNVGIGWVAFAIVLALCATIMVWVARFRLEYGGDMIRYRTLFGGDVELAVSEIASASRAAGVRTYRDRFRPRFRIELVGKPGASFRMVPVNAKAFPDGEFKRFTAFLSQRVRLT